LEQEVQADKCQVLVLELLVVHLHLAHSLLHEVVLLDKVVDPQLLLVHLQPHQ
jgi:hypothetical protein